MNKKKKPKLKIEHTFTLSKYLYGQHVFDEEGAGTPSFAESMSPLHSMINSLYKSGAILGSKVKVTMEVEK